MPEPTSVTKYGVTRDGVLLADVFDTQERAELHLEWAHSQSNAVGASTDGLELVSVEVKTTYLKPKVIAVPAPDDEPAEGEIVPAPGS